MKQALTYIFKVWLTSAVIGSILSYLPFIDLMHIADDLPYILFQIIAAVLLSVDCLLLLWVSSWLLSKRIHQVGKLKLLFSGIGLVLAIGQFLLITRRCCGVDWADRVIFFAYPTMVVISLWFYKLDFVNKEVNAVNI